MSATARTAFFLALAISTSPLAKAKDHPLLIDAEVTVNQDGSVSAARITRPQLPAVIESAAIENIRGMRFRPIELATSPTTVTSQLSFSACVSEDANEQLLLAMQLSAIGPQPLQRKPPPLPRQLILAGSHAELMLNFQVNADGSAQVLDVELEGPRLRGRALNQVKSEYSRWVESIQFNPERVNGEPVATRMEWPVTITVSRSLHRPKPPVEATCKLAKQPHSDGPRVAADSALLHALPNKAG